MDDRKRMKDDHDRRKREVKCKMYRPNERWYRPLFRPGLTSDRDVVACSHCQRWETKASGVYFRSDDRVDAIGKEVTNYDWTSTRSLGF